MFDLLVKNHVPTGKARGVSPQEAALSGLLTALLCLGAYLRIPMPLAPVTMQLFFVVLGGLLLGPRLGVFSVATYLLLGLLGAPVFAGASGLTAIAQPTFGYLLGFLVGAYLAGRFLPHGRPASLGDLVTLGFLAVAAVYAIGVAYLYCLSRVYLGEPMTLWYAVCWGALVFLPGDILLTALAAVLAKRLHPVLCRICARIY